MTVMPSGALHWNDVLANIPANSQVFFVGATTFARQAASVRFHKRRKSLAEKLAENWSSTMSDALRISADELKRRMEAGEDFTIVDVRNPRAWAEASDMAGEAVRIALDDADPLPRLPRDKPIVTYCT